MTFGEYYYCGGCGWASTISKSPLLDELFDAAFTCKKCYKKLKRQKLKHDSEAADYELFVMYMRHIASINKLKKLRGQTK